MPAGTSDDDSYEAEGTSIQYARWIHAGTKTAVNAAAATDPATSQTDPAATMVRTRIGVASGPDSVRPEEMVTSLLSPERRRQTSCRCATCIVAKISETARSPHIRGKPCAMVTHVAY